MTKPLPDRVTDLEETVYGDPHDSDDRGLVGRVKFLIDRETERDAIVKFGRLIALLLGIAIAALTLLEVIRRTGA